jgi:hypothetical protein
MLLSMLLLLKPEQKKPPTPISRHRREGERIYEATFALCASSLSLILSLLDCI